jgi:predicted transposase YbfD/YdcC
MMMVDSAKLHEKFIEWMKCIALEFEGVISIDGKTSRRTKDSEKKALHTVSAFAYERGLVLGQIACEEHSNEITAIPKLLKMLEIKGCIVTIDAMGCQVDIAETIVGKEADYVLALKENQELLYNDIKLYTENEILPIPASKLPIDEYHRTINKGHGRIEIRKYYICNDISWLECSKWAGISGFGLCVSSVEEKGKTSISYRYYIYSVKDMTAQKFAYCCRNHWSVESSLHWVLDVVFCEDDARARKDNSAENFNVFRHFAYNLLKAEDSFNSSITNKQFKCLFDNDYLWKVFSACS